MKNYVTIDCGTTNTRISIVSAGAVIDTLRLSLGARSCGDNRQEYITALRDAIGEIIRKNGYTEQSIERILASGMITSELGIYPLSHLTLPVGIRELKLGMADVSLPEISTIPFSFVRGIRTGGLSYEDADMMRGEEAELVGVMRECEEECVYALMGSHTKIIETDRCGNIINFHTLLTGELAEAVSKHTILKSSVTLDRGDIDDDFLKNGYLYSLENGISATLFKVRIIKNVFARSDTEAYSFFLGAILANDVQLISASRARRVVVGGNRRLKEAISTLLREYTEAKIIPLTDDEVDFSVPLGLVKIYELDV